MLGTDEVKLYMLTCLFKMLKFQMQSYFVLFELFMCTAVDKLRMFTQKRSNGFLKWQILLSIV